MALFRWISINYLSIGTVTTLTVLLLSLCFNKTILQKMAGITIIDIYILILLGYFLVNGIIHTSIRTPLVYWKWAAAGFVYLLGKGLSSRQILVALIFGCIALTQSIVILLQQFKLIPSLCFFFPVSGTFDNPQYPAAIICVGLAAVIGNLFPRYNTIPRFVKCIFGGFAALLLSSLICCGTRSCYLVVLCWALLLISRLLPKPYKVIYSLLLLIGVVVFLYFIRPGSANVRLLIWRVSFPMFLSCPLFGEGVTSFSVNYMFAQATYFASHLDSPLSIWANNHCQPYNEILRLLCEQGIVGLFLFSFFLKQILSTKNFSLLPIISICILGLTFNVSDLYILFLSFWFLVGIESTNWIIRMPDIDHCSWLLIPACACIFCLSLIRITSPQYMNSPKLNSDYPSYEQCCKEGNDYIEKGESEKAILSFTLAWQMIPCRITAPYALFNLYYENGDLKHMIEMADYILNQQRLSSISGKTLLMKESVRTKLKEKGLI